MRATPLAIPDVVLLEPAVFLDERGAFFESFNQAQLETLLDRPLHFVQDNHSISYQYVLRGLHYQIQHPQGKLINVIKGEIFDVVVDIRPHSRTFGQTVCQKLSHHTRQQMWVPEGCAHGFLTLSDSAEVLYKTTDYYAPAHERSIKWNDPTLNIPWPLSRGSSPVLSAKDALGVAFLDAQRLL